MEVVVNGPEQSRKTRIMVVDDAPEIRDLLTQSLLQAGLEVVSAPDGATALRIAPEHHPDLILLDIDMPDMDGYDVCRRFKQEPSLKDIPVIFLSGLDDTNDKIRAFCAGGVDYVTKPFHMGEVLARVGVHLNLRSVHNMLESQKMVERKIREISDAQLATIFALAKLAEQRDGDTGVHLERVQEFCRLLAEQLGKDSPYAGYITHDFVECIQHAAPLHDIGKVAIPDSILLKAGRLTPTEFEVMKTHTVIGAENMQTVYNSYPSNVFIGMGIEIALYHHERWDGTGYPDGLVGKNIPLSARIMGLADFYDALRSDRCYRMGLDHGQVKQMVLESEGTHFDPVIVRAFLAIEREFSQVMDTIA